MTVRLVRHIEIARIAASAGFDTLYVDVEHNGFSWDTTGQICMAALAAGITPFVRVPTTAPEHIAAALNGGALGVIAPHVRSAEEALDQCWDLLHQRRALRNAGLDPEEAKVRDENTVEGYQG